MPLYEYECQKCGRHTDKIEPVNGPHLKKCPHCGGKVESVITAPAIKFKGSGWYVTDYAGKTALGETPEKSDSAKGDKDGSEKSDGDKAEKPDKKDAPAKDASAKDSSSKESKGKDSGKEAKDRKPEKKK